MRGRWCGGGKMGKLFYSLCSTWLFKIGYFKGFSHTHWNLIHEVCIEGLLYIQFCESTKVQRNLYILNDYIYFSNSDNLFGFSSSVFWSSWKRTSVWSACTHHKAKCMYIYILCVCVCVCVCVYFKASQIEWQLTY